jgi:hypothetical protein
MPIRIELEEESGLRVIRAEGALQDEALYQALAALWQAPDYDPTRDELVDASGVTRADVSTEGIRRLAALALAAHPGGPPARIAIVAPTDLLFGTARMYEAFVDAGERQVRAFRSVAEARAWLRGQPPG